MPTFIEGNLDAKGLKFGIVVSRFNSFICERLLEGRWTPSSVTAAAMPTSTWHGTRRLRDSS